MAAMRAHDPLNSCWLTPDPMAGDILNPQSLNKYAYAFNNPTRYVDPTGHWPKWINNVFGIHDPPPPPPLTAPPRMSPQAFAAFLTSLRSQKVKTLSVAQVENIVYNESGGLRPGKAGAKELEKGRIATANAVMNGDAALGTARPQTAVASVTPAAMRTQQYEQSQQTASQAYYDRRVYGQDTAGGRMFFGNSREELQSRPIGDSRQTVYDQFGPFEYYGQDTFIYIYNDPGH
jgi:hypothetical protein